MKEVSLTSDAMTLRGRVFHPQNIANHPLPALLMVHGWRSDIAKYYESAQQLADVGFVVLVCGLRGHGESDGSGDDFVKHSRTDHVADVVAAYNFLQTYPGVDGNRMHGFGTSYGGYLLAVASRSVRFSSMALTVPALHPDGDFGTPAIEMIEQNVEAVKHYRAHAQVGAYENAALSGIAALDETQALFIAGAGADDTIPESVIRTYEDTASAVGSKIVVRIKGADHRFSAPEDRSFLYTLLCGWYKALLSKRE